MSDQKKDPAEERPFEEWLSRGFKALRSEKGLCPDSSRLQSYHLGTLAPNESQEVTRHIENCGVCEALLFRLKGSDASSRDPGAADLQPSWSEADEKLSRNFRAFLEKSQNPAVRSGPPRSGSRLSAFYANLSVANAVACVLILLLVYPAYLGLSRRNREAPVNPLPLERPIATEAIIAMESARIIKLDATRGVGSGGESKGAAKNERTIILSFFVPISSDKRYSGRITDQSGKIIVEQKELTSYDGLGNFYVVCDRRQFPPGPYVLIVEETTPESGIAKDRARFQFEI